MDNRIVLFLFMVGAASKCYGDYITMCDNQNFPLTASNIQIPSPIKVTKGSSITFQFKLKSTKDITGQLQLKLWLKKKIWFWIHIPCIKNVGSCTYNLTPSILNEVGIPKTIKKGEEYLIRKSIHIPSDANIPSFLANGMYRVEGAINEDGTRIGCFKAEVTVKA